MPNHFIDSSLDHLTQTFTSAEELITKPDMPDDELARVVVTTAGHALSSLVHAILAIAHAIGEGK